MKLRTLLMSVVAFGLAQGGAMSASADRLQFMLHTGPSDTDVGVIKVDGQPNGAYNEVLTKTLEYVVSVRGDKPDRAKHDSGLLWMKLSDGQEVEGSLTEQWTKYKLSMPYRPLPPGEIANENLSPVDLCNTALQETSAAARLHFLSAGKILHHAKAYSLSGWVEWIIDKRVGFDEIKRYSDSTMVPVKIQCLGLNRPRPSKDTSTTGAPGPKGKPLPPTVSNATFRIEPAKVVQDGKFLCPSQLKLYGHVEVIRDFYGKALFVGPHYLSAITTLNFQAKGSRNIVGTYDMDWHKIGGFTTAPNAEPKKQKLTFHFNVADKDGKLRKSVEETVEVSCKKVKVAVPTVGDEVTVTPTN
jgi:hypothetical protein